MEYRPRKEQRLILEAAWIHIQSVPYPVSARWLFYRLLQDGFYSAKEDYKARFIPLTSRARHREYQDWRPDTLTDDQRSATYRGTGPTDAAGFRASVVDRVSRLFPPLAHWHEQDYYVEIWFEAAAMRSQFAYYTAGVLLRPFGGDPSIPYLYQAACELAGQAEEYGKPAVVLYFGDRDNKGEQIAKTAERNARKWCAVDFEFHRCGLTREQALDMQVPENPDKPGAWQWEALTDPQARSIIEGGIAGLVDADAVTRAHDLREQLMGDLQPRLETAIRTVVAPEGTQETI